MEWWCLRSVVLRRQPIDRAKLDRTLLVLRQSPENMRNNLDLDREPVAHREPRSRIQTLDCGMFESRK
jgi:hypothetical protein